MKKLFCVQVAALMICSITQPALAEPSSASRGLAEVIAVWVVVEDFNAAMQKSGLRKAQLHVLARDVLSDTHIPVLQPQDGGRVPLVYILLDAVNYAPALPYQARIRPTVDSDVGAVNKSGACGGQEQDQIGNFFRLSDSAHWRHFLERFFLVGTPWSKGRNEFLQPFRENRTGVDANNPHAVFYAFVGERFGEMVDRDIGGPTDHIASHRLEAPSASHVDNDAGALLVHLREHLARHSHIAEKLERPVIYPGFIR